MFFLTFCCSIVSQFDEIFYLLNFFQPMISQHQHRLSCDWLIEMQDIIINTALLYTAKLEIQIKIKWSRLYNLEES